MRHEEEEEEGGHQIACQGQDNSPSLEKLDVIIKKLKNNKSSGINELVAETGRK